MLLCAAFGHPLPVGGRVADSLDRHSMGIYIIHHILIWSALLFIPGLTLLMDSHPVGAPALLFMGALTISWLLSAVMSRNRLLSLAIGNRHLRNN